MRTTVVVLGGGPAGAATATTLARAGVDVLVLDASPGSIPKIGESLPPAVRPLLARLGVEEELARGGHLRAHGHRSWWGSDEAAEEDFLFGTFGAGWHLDRVRFEAMLADAAVRAGARWCWDHHAVDAGRGDGSWTLEVEAPEALVRVEAQLVVDATGRHARFARGAGARQERFDKQIGVAVVLEPPSGGVPELDGFSTVEAQAEGWWYTAPLHDGRVVAVFMTDGDLVDTSSARTAAGWSDLLKQAANTQARVAQHLRHASKIEPRILPAGSARLAVPVGDGWLAVGDAAAAFDPLSSHGIGSALTTGYYGGCAIADHLRGNEEALAAYADLVASMFADYRQRLHEHYALEKRWPSAPFWARRHA